MRRNQNDEFHFDPALELIDVAQEHRAAPEYPAAGGEDAAPPAWWALPPEFAAAAPASAPAKRMTAHERIKRMMLVPIASAIAVLSIVLASYGLDPLGGDFLVTGSLTASPVLPAPGPGTSTPVTPSPGETTAPAAYDDAFPVLPNMDPDFAGAYAWAGSGSEEYLVLDSHYLHAGTYYTNGGTAIDTVSGASYDKSTNTLTLNNYHGSFIDANLMGNGFKICLIGENSLDLIKLWGAMYGGSVTFTGSGSIKLNEAGKSEVGLYLECEDSPSCVMIDREATVEVFGQYAIVIHRSTLEKAIYALKPVTVSGGALSDGEFVNYNVTVTDSEGNPVLDENGEPVTEVKTVKDIAADQGKALYDYSVVGEDGMPAKHVLFAPQK